eukprot:5171600-Prymnesium_polylepis.2
MHLCGCCFGGGCGAPKRCQPSCTRLHGAAIERLLPSDTFVTNSPVGARSAKKSSPLTQHVRAPSPASIAPCWMSGSNEQPGVHSHGRDAASNSTSREMSGRFLEAGGRGGGFEGGAALGDAIFFGFGAGASIGSARLLDFGGLPAAEGPASVAGFVAFVAGDPGFDREASKSSSKSKHLRLPCGSQESCAALKPCASDARK